MPKPDTLWRLQWRGSWDETNREEKMATLKEYFQTDFAHALTTDFKCPLVPPSSGEILVKIGMEMYSNARFVAYYVPHVETPLTTYTELIDSCNDAIEKTNGLEIISSHVADVQLGFFGSSYSVFANKVYIYSEEDLSNDDLKKLDAHCKSKNISLTIRGMSYVKKKMEYEKPLAFISHDSRDKNEIAIHIAMGLQRMLCPVWYDEFSLKVGDSLRETIERGLKETKKCILILTPNFLSNTGWTKTEFNSVFTREIIESRSIVLPVWHNVSPNEIYEYSPSLADKFALNWNLGKDVVVRKLYNAITRDSP